MKKLVKEQLNENYQNKLDLWMQQHGIYVDDDPKNTIYELCKVIMDLENRVNKSKNNIEK